jgi:hypothetical protein
MYKTIRIYSFVYIDAIGWVSGIKKEDLDKTQSKI